MNISLSGIDIGFLKPILKYSNPKFILSCDFVAVNHNVCAFISPDDQLVFETVPTLPISY